MTYYRFDHHRDDLDRGRRDLDRDDLDRYDYWARDPRDRRGHQQGDPWVVDQDQGYDRGYRRGFDHGYQQGFEHAHRTQEHDRMGTRVEEYDYQAYRR